ncbi:GlxA family transcriptional regulator [Nocardia sp. NPDC006044]|uniref:GlxA family transcriptional regulator n=1 Tax=Nocardia sp. NPDC006044 TaxID=3364306 RepID=UPI003684C759
MAGVRVASRPHRVGVLVFPGVTLLDVAGPGEVFTEANRCGADYRITLISPDGAPVRSSTGLRFEVDRAAGETRKLDTLVVPGSEELAAAALPPELVGAVTGLAARTPRIASVCTGAFLLAAAGLLDGRRATTHWRHATTLRRRHPGIEVESDALFVTDGPIMTSAGISAGIDLSLHLVEQDHGPALARDVARALVVFLQRPGGQSQFSVPIRMPAPKDSTLRTLLDTIHTDPTRDYTVPVLAALANTSPRQLTRLFRRELDTTPARYLEQVRLEQAQILLDQGHSVTATAERSGFGSDDTLRRAFQQHLGIAPSTYQHRFTATTEP